MCFSSRRVQCGCNGTRGGPAKQGSPTSSQPHPLCPARQVSLLRRLFKAALGDEAAKLVDINTIDGFQVGEGGACGRGGGPPDLGAEGRSCKRGP